MFVFISRQGLFGQRDPGMGDNVVHTKYFLYERCSSSSTECRRDPPPSQLIVTSSGLILAPLSSPQPSPTSNLQNPEWRNSNTPSGLAMDWCWSIRTTSTIYQTPPTPARWRESLRPALALYSMGSLREFIMVTLTSH